MKIKIRLANERDWSPALYLNYSSQKTLDKFIADFKKKDFTSANPKEAMINFIIFASTYGKGIEPKEIDGESGFEYRDNIEIKNINIRTPNVVEFVYKKDDGETHWRTVDIIEENTTYIRGNDIEDNNKFKSFKKSCIVGGRILKKNKV